MEELMKAYSELKDLMTDVMGSMIKRAVDVDTVAYMDEEELSLLKESAELYTKSMEFMDLAVRKYKEQDEVLHEILQICKTLEERR